MPTFTVSPPVSPTDPTFGVGDMMCYLSDNRALGFFYDVATFSVLKAFVINTDGTTVTSFGLSVSVETVGVSVSGVVPVACAAVDATHVFAIWSKDTTSCAGKGLATRGAVFEVIGNAITVGTIITIDSATSGFSYSVNENHSVNVAVQSPTSVTVATDLSSSEPPTPFDRFSVAQMTLDLSGLLVTSLTLTDLPGAIPTGNPNVCSLDSRYALITWQHNSFTGVERTAVWDSVTQSFGPILDGPPDAAFHGLAALDVGKVLFVSNDLAAHHGQIASNVGDVASFGPQITLDAGTADFQTTVALSSSLGVAYAYRSFPLPQRIGLQALHVSGTDVTADAQQFVDDPAGTGPYLLLTRLSSHAMIGNDLGVDYTVIYFATGGWIVGSVAMA